MIVHVPNWLFVYQLKHNVTHTNSPCTHNKYCQVMFHWAILSWICWVTLVWYQSVFHKCRRLVLCNLYVREIPYLYLWQYYFENWWISNVIRTWNQQIYLPKWILEKNTSTSQPTKTWLVVMYNNSTNIAQHLLCHITSVLCLDSVLSMVAVAIVGEVSMETVY